MSIWNTEVFANSILEKVKAEKEPKIKSIFDNREDILEKNKGFLEPVEPFIWYFNSGFMSLNIC